MKIVKDLLENINVNWTCYWACKEIKSLMKDSNFNKKRLSLLVSNLDCILFYSCLKNRVKRLNLFLKADKFLTDNNVHWLDEAMKRERLVRI
jgi:hypothetical protein